MTVGRRVVENQKDSWEQSYQRGENFLRYPSENIVRLWHKNRELFKEPSASSSLDYGCGCGRHCSFLIDMGYGNVTGFDLSETALELAKQNLDYLGCGDLHFTSELESLEDASFDLVICDSVLDSMHLQNAQIAVCNMHRLLKPGGIVIASFLFDDYKKLDERAEFVIPDALGHERGTVQGYFDDVKIRRLMMPLFESTMSLNQSVQSELWPELQYVRHYSVFKRI